MYNFFMDIILASASPRRKMILESAGYKIEIIPSNYDEKINGLIYQDDLVENCAYQKALDIKRRYSPDKLIVSADTSVVCDGVILGKPKDKNEAFSMLLNLSNKKHFVSSAICLIYQDRVLKSCEKTFVTFKKLTEDEITNYIETQKPYDKAGSYGIQDEGFDFASKVEGELDNVIGFPLKLFQKMLSKI